MDFTKFNTKEAAEQGRFLHLRHFRTGEFLYDEVDGKQERVGITLRGLESKTVQDAVKEYRRRAMAGEIAPDREETAIAQAVVIEFHNIHRGDDLLTTSADDIKWFFDQSSEFVQAVVDFARTTGNFLAAD